VSTPYDADPHDSGAAASMSNPPAGPGAHLDADRVGDLLEGLLDAADAAAAQAHLAGCPRCSRRKDDYLAVRDLLAGLPAVPMPDDVARRLDDAIMAATVGGSGTLASSDATVVPLAGRSQRRRLRLGTGVLQAAAAAVVIAGVAAVGVAAVGGGADSPATQAGSAGMPGGATMAEAGASTRFSATQHTYSAAALAADAARLARGEGPVAAAAPSASDERTSGSGAPDAGESGYSRLAATDALTGAEASDDAALSEVGLPSRAAIDRCTQALGEGRPPLAVDRGTFNGESVLVVVFGREAPDPGYEAWVVGTRCAPGDEQVRTFVLAPG
jgi:hypothetical protein